LAAPTPMKLSLTWPEFMIVPLTFPMRARH
jgi:hypothetical protein